ncbi:MAG: DpnD/PcfM family protein [Chitinophagales bacterium]|jgi:hypothetical protein|nr:DpnD/PcfM family protein [Chitinophagales bacterium]
MPTYKIEIIETLSRVVEVEAENSDVAMDMVQEMYDNQTIVLTDEDVVEVELIETWDGEGLN